MKHNLAFLELQSLQLHSASGQMASMARLYVHALQLTRHNGLPHHCQYMTAGHIYFRGPPVVIRLFFVRYVYYTLICCVWLVCFIVLPELVKHILVAGVVRRNIKFNVKISKSEFRRHVSLCAVADDAVMPIRTESSS